ncbi:MAG: proline dehydrogenase family protein [Candidatus Acidiferrales bacterium]|jgi:proline dehydrogenase
MKSLLTGLSESASLRRFAERSSLGKKLSGRFAAGAEIASALEAARHVNAAGASVTIDNLGENVTLAEAARTSAEVYGRLLEAIARGNLQANISLKLTQMGLDLDDNLCQELVESLVRHAARIGNFVRVDMEGSRYTQRTLDLVGRIHQTPGNAGHVGAVIQASLRRSEADLDELLRQRIRVRLCKGAYKERAHVAFPDKASVDENFLGLSKKLLGDGLFHGIATHDDRLMDELKTYVTTEGIERTSFEFQMLYGVRPQLQEQLVHEGWNLRVYIPFGTAWYPYFMRRIAERPANLAFAVRSIFGS